MILGRSLQTDVGYNLTWDRELGILEVGSYSEGKRIRVWTWNSQVHLMSLTDEGKRLPID